MNWPLPIMPRGAETRGYGFPSLRPSPPLYLNAGSATTSSSLLVRWNLRFKLSYRDLSELAQELGVGVAPSTILRWVVCYALPVREMLAGP